MVEQESHRGILVDLRSAREKRRELEMMAKLSDPRYSVAKGGGVVQTEEDVAIIKAMIAEDRAAFLEKKSGPIYDCL